MRGCAGGLSAVAAAAAARWSFCLRSASFSAAAAEATTAVGSAMVLSRICFAACFTERPANKTQKSGHILITTALAEFTTQHLEDSNTRRWQSTLLE
jgi:hypothetical protein